MLNNPTSYNEIIPTTADSCDDAVARLVDKEIAKRINMHDEIVKSLHDMVEIVGSNFCQNMEIKRKYKIARELLERCKW